MQACNCAPRPALPCADIQRRAKASDAITRWSEMAFIASSEVEQQTAVGWPAAPSRAVLAWRDLAAGWHRRWMWRALALQDIKLRYRGPVPGPFLVAISTLATGIRVWGRYVHLCHVDSQHV